MLHWIVDSILRRKPDLLDYGPAHNVDWLPAWRLLGLLALPLSLRALTIYSATRAWFLPFK